MNEPVMVIQAKSFTSNYANRVVPVFNLYFWPCSFYKQSLLWPLQREKKKNLLHFVLSLNFTFT